MTPLIAISTDFGSDSTYVAQMKGVILSSLPECRLIDVSHSLPAHSVRATELHLRGVAFALPLGAVHLVVVDPGVGSSRAPIAVEARGMRFVGPDNGIFARLITLPGARVVTLDVPHLHRTPVAPTFHGRDIFSPVAAELASGAPLSAVGSERLETVPTTLPEPVFEGVHVRGEVLGADRFGNLTTNIPCPRGARFRVAVSGEHLPFVSTYAEVDVGTLVALSGSDGFLEIARRERPAGVSLGTAVIAERVP